MSRERINVSMTEEGLEILDREREPRRLSRSAFSKFFCGSGSGTNPSWRRLALPGARPTLPRLAAGSRAKLRGRPTDGREHSGGSEMAQRWTDEMEDHWQAVFDEAANPVDFLIARDISMGDRLKGLFRYALAAIRSSTVGGWKPASLRLEIESVNIRRQIGPARLAEIAAFMDEPFDFFEHCDFLNS